MAAWRGCGADYENRIDAGRHPRSTRGLFFLLDAEVQRRLIKKIAGVLRSSSKYLWLPVSREGALSLPTVEPDL